MAGKRKRVVKETKSKKSPLKKSMNICSKHIFSKPSISQIRKELLSWYDANQRDLPWRTIAASEVDPNVRGYAVWVSEVMLQQTQVATVIPYFNKWIKTWPTIQTLAAADLEDVYKVWAGLGYYSRARRLHEGAKFLVTKMSGTMPQEVEDLSKNIPGIGPYSASAIASVAFQKVVGVVDGNVIRVLSRMREVGADSSHSNVRNHLWSLANELVSDTRPGDFNQALMELGATVCTPQNPKCSECAVRSSCAAYSKVRTDTDIGALDSFLKKNGKKKSKSCSDVEECHLCLPDHLWKSNPQVTVFPVKAPKKKPREERVMVLVIDRENRFLLIRRPEEGLLAGLWEFPKIILTGDKDVNDSQDVLLNELTIEQSSVISRKHVAEVSHIFSHIRTTYVVEHIQVAPSLVVEDLECPTSWWNASEVRTAAVSTAVKKILDSVEKLLRTDHPKKDSKSASNKRKKISNDPRQSSIRSFFT